jgi:hypothetical protein
MIRYITTPALRPGPLWLGGGMERYGVTERARRALLDRRDRRQ